MIRSQELKWNILSTLPMKMICHCVCGKDMQGKKSAWHQRREMSDVKLHVKFSNASKNGKWLNKMQTTDSSFQTQSLRIWRKRRSIYYITYIYIYIHILREREILTEKRDGMWRPRGSTSRSGQRQEGMRRRMERERERTEQRRP